MALIGSSDLDKMRADAAAIRRDNEETITIRRGSDTLDPQPVRIVRLSAQSISRDSEGGEEVRGRVIVTGDVTFDVQPVDRFNDSGGCCTG